MAGGWWRMRARGACCARTKRSTLSVFSSLRLAPGWLGSASEAIISQLVLARARPRRERPPPRRRSCPGEPLLSTRSHRHSCDAQLQQIAPDSHRTRTTAAHALSESRPRPPRAPTFTSSSHRLARLHPSQRSTKMCVHLLDRPGARLESHCRPLSVEAVLSAVVPAGPRRSEVGASSAHAERDSFHDDGQQHRAHLQDRY